MAVYLSLFAGAGQQFFTNAGVPLAGGKIYTYGAGGSTPQATYTTSAGNIAHSNPIQLDAAGRVPGGGEIWLTDTLVYKFQLETSTGSIVQTLDNVSASIGSAALVASSGSSLIGFIQAGSGAVARTAQSKMRDFVNILDFGADPTGVASSSTEIQAAADYANSIGGVLYANSGTFRLTSTVTITCNCELSAATFNVNATSVNIGIIVGSTTQEIRARVMSLPKMINTAKTTTGWTGFENSVGIDIANLFMSSVTIPRVNKFGIGVDVGGYTQGNAYNNIFLGELFDNKISLRCRKKGLTGYSNQNAYYGGQYGMTGAEGTAITGSYGVSLEATTNNNTFINPSLEANGNEFQIRFSDSSVNYFVAPRLEIPGGGRIHFNSTYVNGSSGNVIHAAYDLDNGPLATYSGSATTTNKIVGSYFGDFLSYSTKGLSLINTNGDGLTQPQITGYQATTSNFLSKNSASGTDWNYKLYAEGLQGKRGTDAEKRVWLDWSAGRLYLGNNTAAIAGYFAGDPSANSLLVGGVNKFIPASDDAISLGTVSNRWSVVYAANGTIQTSDEREKQDIADLDETEKRVAVTLKSMIKKFRWKDAVEKKGDAARIHVGVMAQEVITAFQAEGLDPMKYAIVCYEEWPDQFDEDGQKVKEAGNRFGIRYEQLLAFIIAAI